MEKYLGKEKAITLIALVITIVVMLILAGVTINLTLGENGIFTTAQQAAKNYTDAQNKEMAGIEDFTNTVDKAINSLQNNYELLGTIIKTENNINYTADGAGNTIPVPVGFSPITTKDQGTKDTGFVIKNDTDGNEFVWVPVKGMDYTYNRYAMFSLQPADELDEDTQSMKIKFRSDSDYYFIEKMPEDEENSVETYGGYYIGRYETGIVGGTKGENLIDGTYFTGNDMKLLIQKGQRVWNSITIGRAITEATGLYNKIEDNVTSKLCSSYAWDTALKFIETKHSEYPSNSKGGNYTAETGGAGIEQPTGYYAVNNIYDMGGNVYEWTTETYISTGIYYARRGGNKSTQPWNGPAAYRLSAGSTAANGGIGFRITLFM